MTYFPALRRQYILWRLAVHGEVNRADLVRTFGVSMSWASLDINSLLTDNPQAASYDKTRKRYVQRRHVPSARMAKIAEALEWG